MNTTISQIMEEPDEVENVVEEKVCADFVFDYISYYYIIVSQKIPYPKSVVFIIITEFCERFCFYGIQSMCSRFQIY